MRVTGIEAVTKDRYRIVLDNGDKFILYKGEIRILKLREDTDISEDTYNQIMKGVLVKRSRLRAMNLLKARDYTEYQLTRKLTEAEYPEEIVRQAIEYVKSFGYINDYKYAHDYISEQMTRRSSREVYLKLQQKGIQREILDAVFNEMYGDNDNRSEKRFDESEVIIKTLRKKHFTGDETYEEKQKLLAYFYRKGFDVETVRRAMDKLADESDC